MEALWIIACVIALQLCLLLVAITGNAIFKWKKGSRPQRVLDFLTGLGHILLLLAVAYMAFYDSASRLLAAEKLQAVWQDKRALVIQLAQQLAWPAIITLPIPLFILLWLTAWGRCPYCGRFPIKREIDRSTSSGTWSCRKYPREHSGIVGVHWWSKAEKPEEKAS